MNDLETKCSDEQLQEYLNNLASQSVNIVIPDKCSLCPYMFEYKCRAEKCIRE